MSTNVTGLRAHRSPQNLEMDLAWQELMAITDLQVCILEHPAINNHTIKACGKYLPIYVKQFFWENTANPFYTRCPNEKPAYNIFLMHTHIVFRPATMGQLSGARIKADKERR